MNTAEYIDGHHHQTTDRIPVVVQILSIIGFGVFSIVAVSLAFSENWIAGLVVGVVLAAIWSGSRTFGGKNNIDQGTAHIVARLKPGMREEKSSGNSSFDAYKADTLARLEEESREFDKFLTRLREARDASEFDQFMDDRVQANKRELNDTAE